MTEFDNKLKGQIKKKVAENTVKVNFPNTHKKSEETEPVKSVVASEEHSDPADKISAEAEKEREENDLQAMDAEGISIEDFESIPQAAAKPPHPFDGYKFAPKIYLDSDTKKETPISKTYIVALSPTVFVPQDPSGMGKTLKYKTLRGNSVTRTVDFPSFHNRMVVDVENGNRNTDIVFDREIKTKEGSTLFCAVVKSHSCRAALLFNMHPQTGKITVNQMYRVLDINQRKKLSTLFKMISGQQLKQIRESRLISGEEEEV